MRALLLDRPGAPLRLASVDSRRLEPTELRLAVSACGVCRTDLHILDGEVAAGHLPLVLGHEIVGIVTEVGAAVTGWQVGDRAGVPWLAWACGECAYCRSGRENLCADARFTGCHVDGGFADETIADARFVLRLPAGMDDVHAAPLLCAGLIGYRALRFAGDAARLGLYGFGAAAHIVAQVAHHEGREVFAFTRPGDAEGQAYARQLGAAWAGGSDERPGSVLDAAIIFAPVGGLVPTALGAVARGGTVVCAGIHMSDVPAFPYELLWGERTLRSVANLTRADGEAFVDVARRIPVRTDVECFPLDRGAEALARLRAGRITGAAAIVPGAVKG